MLDYPTFFLLTLLAAMSPGPDFAIVMKYGLLSSRRSALFATVGIGTALSVHVFYCLVGTAFLQRQNPMLFPILHTFGALYLAFLGIKMLLSEVRTEFESLPKKHAFITGFLTNLANPKAAIFIFTLLLECITPQTPIGLKVGYASGILIIPVLWFTLLSLMITHPSLIKRITPLQTPITRLTGILLLLIAFSITQDAMNL